MRALIIDALPLVCDALHAMLTRIDAGVVTVQCSSLAAAREAVAQAETPFDLIQVDPDLPDAPRAVTFALLAPLAETAKCVVYSSDCTHERIREARAFNAFAYLDKRQKIQLSEEILRRVLTGQPSFPELGVRPYPHNPLDNLSPTEMRVLSLVAAGALNKQIAFDLNIVEATVKSHLSAIFKKLGVQTRTQAVLALKGNEPAER